MWTKFRILGLFFPASKTSSKIENHQNFAKSSCSSWRELFSYLLQFSYFRGWKTFSSWLVSPIIWQLDMQLHHWWRCYIKFSSFRQVTIIYDKVTTVTTELSWCWWDESISPTDQISTTEPISHSGHSDAGGCSGDHTDSTSVRVRIISHLRQQYRVTWCEVTNAESLWVTLNWCHYEWCYCCRVQGVSVWGEGRVGEGRKMSHTLPYFFPSNYCLTTPISNQPRTSSSKNLFLQ